MPTLTDEKLEAVPGQFTLERGSADDYNALSRFHYRAARPATFAMIAVIRYAGDADTWRSRPVAVAILSYPTLNLAIRDRALGLSHLPADARTRLINREIRRISRVIVHPQFRSLGLARRLVRHLCEQCPTRYVEALAVMGHAHPFFERAGMPRISDASVPPGQPVYYLLDKGGEEPSPPPSPCVQGEGEGFRRPEYRGEVII